MNLRTKIAAVLGGAVLATSQAHADLTTDMAAIQTQVVGDVGGAGTNALAILAASLGVWIVLKLIKKAVNKTT